MLEKVLIVGVFTGIDQTINEYNYEINELTSLCEACDMECVEVLTQNLDVISTKTYIGKGKIEEVKTLIISSDIEGVVFNDELTPSQISNLEKVLETAIYDRTFIILEIFRRRARTKEAFLQVELATLKYTLPRLAGLRKGFSRQRGAGGGFAHGRGAGETKLELDRRITGDRIATIKKELDELTTLRKQQRIKRQKNEIKIVSLVGYTNSGKSTTLNALLAYSKGIKKEVLEKDMLFATLETSTRLVESKNLKFLLTDTVGFVQKLPHGLIEAFKSTLEEIKESDLIIHVVDSSNPNYASQIALTNNVLKEIGVVDIPTIYAFNKMDKTTEWLILPSEIETVVKISAKDGTNIEELLQMIQLKIEEKYIDIDIKVSFDKMSLVYKVKDEVTNLNIEYVENGINVKGKVPNRLYNLLYACKID